MRMKRFNPCFSGSLFPTSTARRLRAATAGCFNPCFSGSLFPTRHQREQFRCGGEVSILVLVEVSFRPGSASQDPARGRGVSILVLVEVSFRRGSVSHAQPHQNVSILVLVEVSFRPGISVSSSGVAVRFQSLF